MSATTNKIVELVDRKENFNNKDSYNPNREVECEKCGSTFPNKQHLAPTPYKGKVYFLCYECITEESFEEEE